MPAGQALTSCGSEVFFTYAKKRCHIDFPYDMQAPAALGGRTYAGGWLDLAIDFFAWLGQNPQPGIGFSMPPSPVNAIDDPYDHAYQPAPVPTPPVPQPGQLRLDPAFGGNAGSALATTLPPDARRPGKTFGCGTSLGGGDSLTIAAPFEAPPGYTGAQEVFVGSAEGVVTRFGVDAATGEFVPQAMSEALGFGAWAMAMGEANGLPGKEVIVATYRGLFALERGSLLVQFQNRNLPWSLGRPSFLAIADVVPGGAAEVIFASDRGELAVFDLDDLSVPVATWLEPGLVDVKVLNRQGNPVQLLLLSNRSHVSRVEWNVQVGGASSLALKAVSPRLNGAPLDMESATDNQGTEVVVYMLGNDSDHKESLWRLDPTTLAPIDFSFTQVPSLTQILNRSAPGGGDLEIVDTQDGRFYLLLAGDRILAIDAQGQAQATELSAFQPMLRARDLAIANVTGDDTPEVVLATEAGYVCWLPLEEILRPQGLVSVGPNVLGSGDPGGFLLSFTTPAARQHGVQNGAPTNCNRALAATWGMVPVIQGSTRRLDVLDQSGSLWSVDAGGNVTLRHEIGGAMSLRRGSGPNALTIEHLPLAGPFRGMATLGPVLSSSVAANAALGAIAPFAVTGSAPAFPGLSLATTVDIRTFPFVPIDGLNLGLAQVWAQASPLNPQTIPIIHHLQTYDGLAVFPRGGDVLDVQINGAPKRFACWWSGQEHDNLFGNRVQGLRIDIATSAIDQWWSTIAPTSASNPAIQGRDLRSYHYETLADRHAQALRLFADPSANHAVRCAVLTPAARLIVLEPGTGPFDIGPPPKEIDTQGQELDFGNGGMALAVAPPRGSAVDLYVGAMIGYGDLSRWQEPVWTAETKADDLVSVIAGVTWSGGGAFGNGTLTRRTELSLDGIGGRPKVFGVCGLRVGEITPSHPGLELVVGALDGHLLVYGLEADGAIGALLYQTQVEGSVGAYNALVLADLDNDGQNELYAAGSLGLRRWIFEHPVALLARSRGADDRVVPVVGVQPVGGCTRDRDLGGAEQRDTDREPPRRAEQPGGTGRRAVPAGAAVGPRGLAGDRPVGGDRVVGDVAGNGPRPVADRDPADSAARFRDRPAVDRVVTAGDTVALEPDGVRGVVKGRVCGGPACPDCSRPPCPRASHRRPLD